MSDAKNHLAMFAEAIADVVGLDSSIIDRIRSPNASAWQEALKDLARRIADLANEARATTPDHRAIKERFMRDLIYLNECDGFDDVRTQLLDLLAAVNRTDFEALVTDHVATLRKVDARLARLVPDTTAPIVTARWCADTHDRSI